MDMPEAIAKVINGQDLSKEEMNQVMQLIMTGEATAAQIGGFLVGLRMKGETAQEIAGAAEIMRALATPVQVPIEGLVDTCGTGGSGINKFNVSTASAFVAAAPPGVSFSGASTLASLTGFFRLPVSKVSPSITRVTRSLRGMIRSFQICCSINRL